MSHRLSSWREKEREREGGRRGEKKKEKEKRWKKFPFLEESCSSSSIIVLPSTSNVSSGNKNKKAGESRCGGIDS